MFILLKLPHTSWHKIQSLKLDFLSETSSVIVLTVLLSVSGLIWLILLTAWGRFWQCDQRLETALAGEADLLDPYPKIAAVIPARNEAEVIATSVKSLLNQDYPGELCLWVVDDQSEDGTATIVQELAQSEDLPAKRSLRILPGQPLPPGWTGKLWALEQGTQRAIQAQAPDFVPDYLWLTDADIAKLKTQLTSQGITIDQAEPMAIAKGMSAAEFAKLKARVGSAAKAIVDKKAKVPEARAANESDTADTENYTQKLQFYTTWLIFNFI